MDETNESEAYINEFSEILTNSSRITDDYKLPKTDIESMGNHSHDYDSLLHSYTTFVERTLSFKKFAKCLFFWVSIVIMGLAALAVIICVVIMVCNLNNDNFNYKDYIIPCITAFSSFLTVFIIIPKIIAKYLFNSGEESVMKDIVVSIQDYDKMIRKKLNN